MSRIFVNGIGAVSPAGWGVPAMRSALETAGPLTTQKLPRPGREEPLLAHVIPTPPQAPAYMTHPRLRRTSSITQYVVASAVEALGDDAQRAQAGGLRLGIVVTVMAGGVNYTRRFFEETIRDPATASPMIFPETVFNAPASHLAAFLDADGLNYTLVGDDGTFIQGLVLAANWLCSGRVEGCVVIGAEEQDWIIADALSLFDRHALHSSGAGALYLGTTQTGSALAELEAVTDAFGFTRGQSRAESACKMRRQLPRGGENELLSLGSRGSRRADADEQAAWSDWTGARHEPKRILGEAFAAATAWQCIDACDSIHRGGFPAANVSVVGANQQAIGARFIKPGLSTSP